MILAALLAVLAGAPTMPPPPLACPPGLEKHGDEPFQGYEVWCEKKDVAGNGRREGPSRLYYDDGGLWQEAVWKDGKRDGPFVEYHRNGVKAREGRYAADAMEGPWTFRRDSGLLEEEAEFRAGVPHGRFVAYGPSGRKLTEGQRCLGAPCGLWRTWSDDGRLEGEVRYETPVVVP